jgi:glycosyltransferase involved in cell wall biosynthesis
MRSTDFVNQATAAEVTRIQGDPLAADMCRVGPLRIVLVAPPYFDVPPTGYGGVEAVVADLADALVARGHQVTLLGAGRAGTAARFMPLWDRTLPDRVGQPYPEVMNALKVRRAVACIAAADGIDIVHDHTFAGPLNAPAYRGLGITTVVTVHGPLDDDLQLGEGNLVHASVSLPASIGRLAHSST